MRLNYYTFPENIDAHTQYKNGAERVKSECAKNQTSCVLCPYNKGEGFRGCEFFKCLEANPEISGISITRAKKLLTQFGGSAYTSHIDRSGCVFEVTPITLDKSNSSHTYNHHL